MKRILFINNTDAPQNISELISNEIVPSLNRMDILCVYHDISVPDNMTEQIAADLISTIKDNEIEYVMTMDYYPALSLFCGAMNIKYLSWIIDRKSDNLFDYSLINDWNYIFVSDSSLYKEYTELNLVHCSFIPLAPSESVSLYKENHKTTIRTDKDINEVYLWTECMDIPSSIGKILPDLKDSTKGYIDGAVEVRKRDISIAPLYKTLPSYVTDDIESHYSADTDSYERADSVFDRRIIFPHIDASMGYVFLLQQFARYKYTLVSDHEGISFKDDTKIIKRSEAMSILLNTDKTCVCAYVQPLLYGSLISQDVWNVMRAGHLVLLPDYVDTSFLKDCYIPKFANNHEAEQLTNKYLTNPKERVELADQIHKNCLQLGGYIDRLNELFSKIE